MILTCPACDTKYVVKDGAIPPAGRKVRCASCQHSWHQDPDPTFAQAQDEVPMAIASFGGPPEPSLTGEAEREHFGEVPPAAESEQMIADIPEPAPTIAGDEPEYAEVEDIPPAWPVPEGPASPAPHPLQTAEQAPLVEPPAAERPAAEPEAVEHDGEYVGYVERYVDEDERPKRRWPAVLLILFLIAIAAAAFWFLAPPEWKARAGIAQAGVSPLQLMITTSDRQPLESGNELVAISGRVFNPTDTEQKVPAIHAELRNKQSRAVVHKWTIAPPARVLGPRASANFNSAEVDVPQGGDELTVTLGV